MPRPRLEIRDSVLQDWSKAWVFSVSDAITNNVSAVYAKSHPETAYSCLHSQPSLLSVTIAASHVKREISSVLPASCSPKSSLWDEGDEVKSALFHSVEPEDLFSADVVHRSSRRHTQQRAQAAAESQGQGANVGRTALRPETGAMSRWPGVEYPKMQRSFSFRDSTEKYWKRKNS